MKHNEVNYNRLTPVMKQYVDLKAKHKDSILFFRLGDFYEMFFEDAVLVSKLLEITLTGKSAGLDERIPMCGVPHHSAQAYIEKLINYSYKVSVCEQLEDPKQCKGIVKRGVVQIISKGTIINAEALLDYENNYLGNLIYFHDCYAISYSDISTGELFAYIIEDDLNKVINEILNNNLTEIVVTNNINEELLNILLKQDNLVISYHETYDILKYEKLYENIKDGRLKETVKHLLSYIDKTQKRELDHFQEVIIKTTKETLKMDVQTIRNLELTTTIKQKTRKNSLIWLLDKTKTAMGARELKKMLLQPLIDKKEIVERYNIVETLIKDFILREELEKVLEEVYDLERLSGKVAFGNCNARDLLQLKKSLKVLPIISHILEKINYKEKIIPLDNLYNLLELSIYENPPITIKEGYLIKDGYNAQLDELKQLRSGGKHFLAKFELIEREKTGIKNLKIGYNKIFGYYIEITKGNLGLVKEEYGYERKQTLANCERYISPILKEKEALILNAEDKIIELEYELFVNIREEIKKYIKELQFNAKIISKIDVFQSFSKIAEQNNYVRPIIIDTREIMIKENRHPVVEHVLKEEFVPNDIIMDEKTNILLITGPNMAGKSTYMRQMALTVIMAQIGSFVPAKSATMPIFDAIYTRIGASDDLVSGESTFMVEMNEANYAINNATKNSLILFDELGRGTATFDGMALAQAIIEYIHEEIGAKTMFSTHYHEITDLEETLPNLKNIHVSAYEEAGEITFLHKIKEGSVDKSYGIHVAKLAKLPTNLIVRANSILKTYEQTEIKRDLIIREPLIKKEKSIIDKELEEINLMEITPIEALNILYDLKGKQKEAKEKVVL